MEDGTAAPSLVPRCSHVVRWPHFNGYGFNLHAEKGRAGQYIGKVDTGSPAEAAGLRPGDRIVEVNGINIGNENHQQVVGRIKSGGDEARLLVVDTETDMYYKSSMTVVKGDLPEVRFITSKRDDDEIDSTPKTNGSAFTTTTAASEPPASGYPAPPPPEPETTSDVVSPYHPVRLCKLCKWGDFDGYGFNLHAEKDKPGQFIGAVDAASPAETGGLKSGDRILEVNGANIEGLNHGAVIQRVKNGGDRVVLLVVDREADAYYQGQGQGQSLSSQLPGVTVIVTPPTSKGDVVDINSNEQSSEPEPSLTTLTPSEEPTSYSVEKSEEAEVAAAPAAAETEVAALATETEVTNAEEEDVNLSTLPEPNVSLSDEESETITAVTADAVESTPEPQASFDDETVPNGHQVEKEEEEDREEEEKKEEEEEKEEEQVAVVTSTSDVITQADDVVVVEEVVEGKKEEEEEQEEEEDEDLNDYEQVEVVAAAVAVPAYSAPPPAVDDRAEEDLGSVSYVINGGEEVPEPEPEPEPRRVEPEPVRAPAPIPTPMPIAKAPEPEPEPVPAVIRSTAPSVNSKPAAPSGPAMGGDLHLFMSAAEMKERLKARKKQDPRYQKTSFEAKSKMFEKL